MKISCGNFNAHENVPRRCAQMCRRNGFWGVASLHPSHPTRWCAQMRRVWGRLAEAEALAGKPPVAHARADASRAGQPVARGWLCSRGRGDDKQYDAAGNLVH